MKLLVIEDEHSLLESIVQYFSLESFTCDTADSYEEGFWKIKVFQYNCIILNPNIAHSNWPLIFKFLGQEKRRDGVIIISNQDTVDDKIHGLKLGADDYLAKPFQLTELNARVRALIRRKYAQGANVLQVGPLKADLQSRTLQCAENPVPLSDHEYNLLLLLMTNKNRIVPLQHIAEHLHNGPSEQILSFDSVYTHVKNLKKKLKQKGCQEIIHSVYALGYKLTS